MLFNPSNFLAWIKNLVTGGGVHKDGTTPYNDSGYLKRDEGVSLATLRPITGMAVLVDSTAGTADGTLEACADLATAGGNTYTDAAVNAKLAILRNWAADLSLQVNEIIRSLKGTANEANAPLLKVEEAVDSIGTVRFVVPRDYDENTDELKLRVKASMVSVAVDTDVQLDSEMYVKRGVAALSADKNPTKPSTVLALAPAWVTFNLSRKGLVRDDIVYIKLITDGHNDTNGEEVLIHDFELVYRSTLVSYNERDSSGNDLR